MPSDPSKTVKTLQHSASDSGLLLPNNSTEELDNLLSTLTRVNSTLDSSKRRRLLAREASCRGVPGLPKSEDYQLPKYVEVDKQRVQELVQQNSGAKRGLRMTAGGEEFVKATYLKPKTLNAWQIGRAIQPPRTYKAFRGKDYSDPRQMYRFRSVPSEFEPPSEEKMGEQHRKWLEGHYKQRERHLYPIYFYHQKKEIFEREKEKRKQAEKDGATSKKPPLERPITPEIGPEPVNTDVPWQLDVEERRMKNEYLDTAKERIATLDAQKKMDLAKTNRL